MKFPKMATMNKIIIYFSLILFASGEPVPCNDKTTMGDDGIQCQCQDESFFYNSYEGKCQGVCEFFGNSVCTFYSDKTVCIQNQIDPTDFECQCEPGYVMDVDSGMCVDADECNSLSCSESDNEMCYNMEGEDVCDCIPNYFRNQDHKCQEIDLCIMPVTLSPCEQLCTFNGNDTFTCSCNNGFVVDHHNDTWCSVDVGHLYMDCFCQSPDISHCTQSANATQYCYPSPGYEFNYDHIIVDIDECKNMTYQCPLQSTCVNDIGSYHCECLPGYYQVDEDFVLSGCEPMACPDGTMLYEGDCIDPCEGIKGISCPEMSVCVTDEGNVPKCLCQVRCQDSGLTNSSTFSIYSLKIGLPYEDATAFELSQKHYLLTTSMELIFGKGNAEVVKGSIEDEHPGFIIAMEIGVSMPLEDTNVMKDVILKNCWALEQSDIQSQCVLPMGLIINRYSIDVEEIHRCEDSTMCEDIPYSICVESDVSSGRSWCPCMDGFELIKGLYCQDINECITGHSDCEEGTVCVNQFGNYTCEIDVEGITTFQYLVDDANRQVNAEKETVTEMNRDMDEQERKTKAVGGAIGGIFAVLFIILVVSLVYIFRIRSKTKSKLEKISPEGEGEDAQSGSPSPGRTELSTEPSDLTPETSDPSNEPSDLNPEPDLTDKPSDLSPGHSDLTPAPTDLTSKPTDLSPEPSDPTPEPSDLISKPSDITPEPSYFTPERSDLTPEAFNLTHVPSDLTPEPFDPSPELSDPTFEPSQLSPEPSSTSSDLLNPSSEPSDISSKPTDSSADKSNISPGTSDSTP